MKVTNRLSHNNIESNLVYPSFNEWDRVCVVDPEWIKSTLLMLYGMSDGRINNKYVVRLDDRLYYQHDEDTWLIEKK